MHKDRSLGNPLPKLAVFHYRDWLKFIPEFGDKNWQGGGKGGSAMLSDCSVPSARYLINPARSVG